MGVVGRTIMAALAWLCSLLTPASLAFADPTDSRTVEGADAARQAFQEGADAAAEERWADSERAFGRAYTLSRAPSALFNQAVALRALGKHLEARNALDGLLDMEDGRASLAMRREAYALREESAARVRTLTLSGLSASPHEVRIDGKALRDPLARPFRIELNEGKHTIWVARDGYVPFSSTADLTSTPRLDLTVSLQLRPYMSYAAPSRHPRLTWWIGGAVAVAAGLATTAVLVSRNREGAVEPRASAVFEVP